MEGATTGAYTVDHENLILHPLDSKEGVTYAMTWTDNDNMSLKPLADKDTPPGQTDDAMLKVLTMQLHRLNADEQISQQTIESEKNNLTPKPTPASESEDCVSHVKQLTLGMTMYSEDYDEVYPTNTWQSSIEPYVKDRSYFNCPERTKAGATDGYAMSNALVGTKAQAISNPATEAAIFDADLPGPNAVGSLINDLPKPPRHSKGNTVGYVDGHTTSVP